MLQFFKKNLEIFNPLNLPSSYYLIANCLIYTDLFQGIAFKVLSILLAESKLSVWSFNL